MSDYAAMQPSVCCWATYSSTPQNCLGIISFMVKGMNGKSCETYALLDDGADKTLCDERLLDALNVSSRPVTFNISTVNSTGSTTYGQKIDLQVQGVNSNDQVNLHIVWSVKRLPISVHSAVVSADITKLSYLKDIDVSNIDTKDGMLLIGTDSPAAHIPFEVGSGNNDQPYTISTCLGWAICGPVGNTNASDKIIVNFQQSSGDVLLQQQLERMWATDLYERTLNESEAMSIEDKHALNIMESFITPEDGHYKIALPWRDEATVLPNNMVLAHAYLRQLKRKVFTSSSVINVNKP